MDQTLPSRIPGVRYVGVPPEFREHPLLSRGPYFTLPAPLLVSVVREVGKDRFDAELLDMEHVLSNVCGDHRSRVGFWGGQPIDFPLLRPGMDLTSDFLVRGTAKLLGKSPQEARALLALGEQRLNWTHEVRRGYCGWLMTNGAFVEEHWRIFESWRDEVTQHGIPRMGPVVRDASAVPGAQLAEGRTESFLRQFEEFFIRWRLEGMPAPFVPNPMGPSLPVIDLRPVLGHMRRGGTTFHIPDTFPVPSRDELRSMLEDALRERTAPDHLAEWFEIVHSENVTKNQIPRYARIFEVQHYLRVLHARHATALRRKKSVLMTALANFLRVSEDTVERDLAGIAGRLGPDWYLPSS